MFCKDDGLEEAGSCSCTSAITIRYGEEEFSMLCKEHENESSVTTSIDTLCFTMSLIDNAGWLSNLAKLFYRHQQAIHVRPAKHAKQQ